MDSNGRFCEICGEEVVAASQRRTTHRQIRHNLPRGAAPPRIAPSQPPAPPLAGHSPLRHYQWMGRHVLNEIRKWGYAGPGRDAMVTLRREVLGGLLLRRTKAGRAADLALPARLITVRDDLTMDEVEEDFYEALYTQVRASGSCQVFSLYLVCVCTLPS